MLEGDRDPKLLSVPSKHSTMLLCALMALALLPIARLSVSVFVSVTTIFFPCVSPFLLSSFLLSESNEPPSPIIIRFFLLPRFPGWHLVLSRLTAPGPSSMGAGRRPGPRGISACFRAGRNCCALLIAGLSATTALCRAGAGRVCFLLIVVTQAQFNSTYSTDSPVLVSRATVFSSCLMWPGQSQRGRSYEYYV